MNRTKLKDSNLDDKLWVKTIDIVIFILIIGPLRNNYSMTLYNLWKGRLTNVKYLKIFRSKCYIKGQDQKLGKFESRVDEGILISYSHKRKTYRFYNMRQKKNS